jgi:hypothetical protein
VLQTPWTEIGERGSIRSGVELGANLWEDVDKLSGEQPDLCAGSDQGHTSERMKVHGPDKRTHRVGASGQVAGDQAGEDVARSAGRQPDGSTLLDEAWLPGC